MACYSTVIAFISVLFVSLSVCGEIKLGVILPFTGQYNMTTANLVTALKLAANEINSNNIIPNSTLTLIWRDSGAYDYEGMYQAFDLIQNEDVVGIIGEKYSFVSKAVAFACARLQVPQISASSTNPELSNKTIYPYFLRNIPPDDFQSLAIAQIIHSFGWTRIATISTTDAYGTNGMNAFLGWAKSYNINILASQNIDPIIDPSEIITSVGKIVDSGARIIVLFMLEDPALAVFHEASKQEILGGGHVWVTSDGIIDLTSSGLVEKGYPELIEKLRGIITVYPNGQGPKYNHLLDVLQIARNTSEYPAEDTELVAYMASHYDIPFIYAEALSRVIANGESVNNGTALLNELKKTHFAGASGNITFNSNGDCLNILTAIMNWQVDGLVEVGYWDTQSQGAPPPSVIFPGNTTTIPSDKSKGLIWIGVLLPFESNYDDYVQKEWSLLQAALDFINREEIVPGIIVKFHLESASTAAMSVVKSVKLSEQDRVVGIIGCDTSELSTPVALLLGQLMVPQLSYAATSSELSNKVKYPYFMRIVPSDTNQARVLADLIKKFGWKNVGVLSSEEDYGKDGLASFNEVALRNDIKVIVSQTFKITDTDLSHQMRVFREKNVRVIVTIVSFEVCNTLYSEIWEHGMMSAGYVWIHTDTCGVWGRSYDPDFYNSHPDLVKNMAGMLAIAPYSGSGPSYDNWVSSLASYNTTTYPGLDAVAGDPYASYIFDAPFVFAYALRDVILQGGQPSNSTLLLEAMRNVNITGITGNIFFDQQGDRTGEYIILNWKNTNNSYVEVGKWSPEKDDVNIYNSVVWLGGASDIPVDLPESSVILVPFPFELMIILISIAGICTLLALFVLFVLIWKWGQFILYDRYFCLMIVIGVLVGYSAVFVVLVEPTDVTCMAFPWLTACAFWLVFGSLFLKAQRVWKVFEAASGLKRRVVVSRNKFLVIGGIGLAVENAFMVMWLVLDPLKAVSIQTFTTNVLYTGCSGNSIVFWIIYIFLQGIQLPFGIVLAIKIRNVRHEFNESKSIAMCIYNITAVGIIVVPLGLLLRPLHTAIRILQVVALLIVFTFSLIAIFAPKVLTVIHADKIKNFFKYGDHTIN